MEKNCRFSMIIFAKENVQCKIFQNSKHHHHIAITRKSTPRKSCLIKKTQIGILLNDFLRKNLE